ncbi:hypothetical protein B0H34DRAFT_685091 [Crassisporium funariophilum]|nr:hypothetical protein B0H34DRAFT_685091 [Crassisporium funariophilum]
MSSDGYFDGDSDFDDAALQQLQAIEAAHFSPGKSKIQPTNPLIRATKPALTKERSFYDLTFDVDESDLAQLDDFIEDSYQGKAQPVAGPSKLTRTSSMKLQTTLFGDIIQPVASSSSSKPKSQLQRSKSNPRNPFGQQPLKTKKWDQTAFAKSGTKRKKGKGKAKAGSEDEEPAEEFEQFPAPFPPPMKLTADLLEAKHWIYPINRPKRDYQYNIVKNCLFENTLVALPTGLGKTLIAGVVMLNYYRWFPEGKVIFVAPTKPLVAQQITACHEACGIPGRDSMELNGEVPKARRAKYWAEKRVFFMTPQTLENDLDVLFDIRDVILLVIDEAHRACGDYSYNKVVRHLMAKNPHFRILALTATPGNNPEAVQTLIDGLHISHIEIRDDQSLDLKPYIHEKVIVQHIIKPNEDIGKLKDLFIKAMDPFVKELKSRGLLYPSESAVSLHPFRPTMIMGQLKPDQRGLYASLSKLSTLARAIMYLLTGSIGASYEYLMEQSREREDDDGEGGKKKSSKGKSLREDPNIRQLLTEFEVQRARGFCAHPKVNKLKEVLIQHFGSKISDGEQNNDENNVDETRVMVFSSFRSVVDEIVEELDKERPLIRATRFIGQATDKQGKKGLGQKEQLEVIKKFKAGEYNVLVATCIGEEGLDIGEIDITVCYDADKAPTRMVQRFGRTGRKRAGTVHALLAESREEFNLDKARDTYKEVNKTINRGELYELYADVSRLLPEHMKPECIEKVVEIEEFVREEKRTRGSPKKTSAQAVKRKRDDIARNIPEGASSGFVSVRDLIVKAPKKRKVVAEPKNFEAIGKDDDTDEEIACGRVLTAPRRTQSAAAGTSKKTASKSKLRKSATMTGTKPSKQREKKKLEEEPTQSQFSRQGADDSDDLDIEQGAILPLTKSTAKIPEGSAELMPQKSRRQSTPKHLPVEDSDDPDIEQGAILPSTKATANFPGKSADLEQQQSRRHSSPKHLPNTSILELSDSDSVAMSPASAPRSRSPQHRFVNHDPMEIPIDEDADMGWIVDDDDDDNFDFEIVDSSPIVPKHELPLERIQIGDESIEITMPQPSNRHGAWNRTPASLVDDSVEFVGSCPSPGIPREKIRKGGSSSPPHIISPYVSPSLKSDGASAINSPICPGAAANTSFSSPIWKDSSSPLQIYQETAAQMPMPPPALPRRFLESPTSPNCPEPSFPVRAVGARAKKRRIAYDEPDSPFFEMPAPSQRRLHRIESTPTIPKKSKEKTNRAMPTLLGRNRNLLFDGEAAHSGDEASEGYSNSEDDEETEYDRGFLKDSPGTQVTQSYNQTLAYRQSLFTQAPGNGAGPAFANHPTRPRPFGRLDGPRGRHRDIPSSSPPPPDEELDHYDVGSFVVDDDEEISYLAD